jgi:hypothetical protein
LQLAGALADSGILKVNPRSIRASWNSREISSYIAGACFGWDYPDAIFLGAGFDGWGSSD